MLHGLVAIATPLERADTSEATGLHTYAPPLYSADRVLTLLVVWKATQST
ncbi:MAG: hypothetical protein H0U18_04595 [Pyrinomonadaceae bacterium]|nr:hypothetical protein [Pyrinomonadaceae bacterium]